MMIDCGRRILATAFRVSSTAEADDLIDMQGVAVSRANVHRAKLLQEFGIALDIGHHVENQVRCIRQDG